MEWKINILISNEENHLLEPMKAQVGGFVIRHRNHHQRNSRSIRQNPETPPRSC